MLSAILALVPLATRAIQAATNLLSDKQAQRIDGAAETAKELLGDASRVIALMEKHARTNTPISQAEIQEIEQRIAAKEQRLAQGIEALRKSGEGES